MSVNSIANLLNRHVRIAALVVASVLTITLQSCGGGGGDSPSGTGSSTLTHSVNASWDGGMTVSPASQSVVHGRTAAFTLSFKPGWGLATATGCGSGGALAGNTYTTDTIGAPCTMTFTSKVTYMPTSIRLKPAALFADEFAGTPVTVEVPTVNATGLKLYAEYFSGYFNRNATGGIVQIPLLDNGTNGDRMAGDGIYTAMFTIGQLPLLRYHDNTVDSFPITITTYDEAGNRAPTATNLVNVVNLGVVTRAAAVPVETVASDIRAATHVVNVVLDNPADHVSMWRRVSQFYPDAFDGFASFIVGNTVGSNTPSAGTTKNDVDGIGLAKFDNTATWGGNPSLRNVIFLQTDIVGRVFLHEFAHRWAFTLNAPSLNLTGGSNVHMGVSTVLGQLSSNSFLQPLPNGDYQVALTQGGENYFSRRYADIELYLMGLLAPQALGPEKFVTDLNVNTAANAIIPASKATNVTADDIVRTYGVRLPSFDVSQKRFRLMFVVLSTVPATAAEMALVNRVASYYEGSSVGDVLNEEGAFPVRSMRSFRSATRGLGELATRLPARK